jgi:protein gp37
MMPTKIEWATDSWNPIQAKIKGKTGRGYHCTKVSPGCDNCYAEATNILRGNGLPFDSRATEFELVTKTLEAPLHCRKPRRVFVQSMSDLFHEMVPFKLIDEVFKIMARCPQHTFMLLTKRPEMMLGYLKWLCGKIGPDISELVLPKNVWWGVTAENQEQADKRIPVLLQIPAAVRFVSVEPMLGPVDIKETIVSWKHDQLNKVYTEKLGEYTISWVICGGESGHSARPMHPDWARSLRDQCQTAQVPFFFKQWGEWEPVPGHECVHIKNDKDFQKLKFSPDGNISRKVGKKKAGRLLDGIEWNQFPEKSNV